MKHIIKLNVEELRKNRKQNWIWGCTGPYSSVCETEGDVDCWSDADRDECGSSECGDRDCGVNEGPGY